MTLTIDLTPELETRLLQAAAQQGLNPNDYVRSLIEGYLPPEQPEDRPLWETLTREEWKREFHAWIDSHRDLAAPVIPLEALRRENL